MFGGLLRKQLPRSTRGMATAAGNTYDVVVIGGGPGGYVAGKLLSCINHFWRARAFTISARTPFSYKSRSAWNEGCLCRNERVPRRHVLERWLHSL